jgi:hypothetical protein
LAETLVFLVIFTVIALVAAIKMDTKHYFWLFVYGACVGQTAVFIGKLKAFLWL